MWNPATDGVHVTRNKIWLRHMFDNKLNKERIIGQPLLVEGADSDLEIDDTKNNNDPNTGDSSAREGVVKADDGITAANNRTLRLNNLNPESKKTSRSGRTIRNPAQLIEEIRDMAAKGAIAAESYKMKLSSAEVHYYHVMEQLGQHPGEMTCVGMGMGGGFDDMHELHVMKYDEAMATEDKKGWQVSTDDEHGVGGSSTTI
jgi:hypothetical protein